MASSNLGGGGCGGNGCGGGPRLLQGDYSYNDVPQNMQPGYRRGEELPLDISARNGLFSSNCINNNYNSYNNSGGGCSSGSGTSTGIVNSSGCTPPVYNWQATKTTLKERFAFLFNSEVLSDVHFLVGKGAHRQRIPAHKFLLSVGSVVFDAMFNSTLATTADEIELPDVEPAAFLHLLKFLYSDEVQIGPETVMTTLYTAKKYAVSAFEEHCVDFLKSNLGSDNAFLLLTQARLFDEQQLAALCLDMIDKNTSDALIADGFTDIDQDTLQIVLER